MADDIVTRLRDGVPVKARRWSGDTHEDSGGPFEIHAADDLMVEAADEIERLRAEIEALHVANHEAMWDDTLLPIAVALGVSIDDEHGVPRRHFQMVEAIIKEARRDRAVAYKAARGAATAPVGSPDSVALIRKSRDS